MSDTDNGKTTGTTLEDINIRHFKLSTGENIIGIVIDPSEVESDELDPDEALIILNRPMRVEIVEKTDRTLFLFHEWQPLSKYPYCFINPTHVVSHVECDEGTKERYIRICISSGESGAESDDLSHEGWALDQEGSMDIDEFLDDLDLESKLSVTYPPNGSGSYH